VRIAFVVRFVSTLLRLVMKRSTILFASLFTAMPYVAGHGFVMQLTIAGQLYNGNFPSATTSPSGIREISTQDPVKGANNSFLNCGQNAQSASLVLSANPGDPLTFNWRAADASNVGNDPL
jgi:hypothetical protein